VPIASDCPQGFTLRDGWCMPPVATVAAAPSIWQQPSSPAPVARLPGPGAEALQAEDLYTSGDFTAATTLALKGCDAGDGFGCGLAGRMIGRGQGRVADSKRGAELLRRGCSMGDPWSCTQMGP